MRWTVVLAALMVSPAIANEERIARFAFLAETVGPLCAQAASEVCAETAFVLVDENQDEALTLEELTELRNDLALWLNADETSLTSTEANTITLALWIIDTIGLATLFESYDADADDRLDFAELTADIELDERPLGVVVLDSDAIDWPSLRERLGVLTQALPLPQ